MRVHPLDRPGIMTSSTDPPRSRVEPTGETTSRARNEGPRLVRLVDSDDVARGVAHGAVTQSVGLVGGFLNHRHSRLHETGEDRLEVGSREYHHREVTFRHHLSDHPTLLLTRGGIDGRRSKHHRGVGLFGRSEGEPAHSFVAHVETEFESEEISVEVQRGLGVNMGQKTGLDGEGHGVSVQNGMRAALLRS